MSVRDKLIMDVGAHTGEDSEFYLRKGFMVVAVEAFPPHAAALRKRFEREIAEGRMEIVAVGIGDRGGLCDFFIHPEKDDWHRASPDPTRGEFNVIQVPFVTFNVLLEKHPTPYYLKIDIEDNDWFVINRLSAANRPSYVSFEISKGWEAALNHLRSIGYGRFQIVNQGRHYDLRAPFPAREGSYFDAKFSAHTTGLFGRELPEDGWLDFEAHMRKLLALDWSTGNWYDIHASCT